MIGKKRVLIVGGGFGGVRSALELAEDKNLSVTLVSDRPNFQYHPTLYRTATGGRRIISSIPLSQIFDGKNIKLVRDTAEKLDANKKTIICKSGSKFTYDYLILALGSITNYFGIDGLAKYSYGIKNLEDAEELKAHLHQQLVNDQKPDPHYIIVGGGPTGVELAGALPGYIKAIMKSHGLKPKTVHVDLIEAAPRLTPRMPKAVSKAIAKRLRKIGVKVHLGKTVQGETADGLVVDGKPIKSQSVIWTAGVANNPFFKENNFKLNDRGKVIVNEYLEAMDGVYVLGDNIGSLYSGMAQTAVTDGEFVASNIKKEISGDQKRPYKPKKPVYVMPAGPHWAAVVWGKIQLFGLIGWLLRRAGDWVGYRDVETWWKATELSLAEGDSEESCTLCAPE